MRIPIQTILIASTATLWSVLAALIIRQRYMLNKADPMSDTGLSFGYTFLVQIAAPGLLAITLVVMVALAWMKRCSRLRALRLDRLPENP
jgi:hypothetical protein